MVHVIFWLLLETFGPLADIDSFLIVPSFLCRFSSLAFPRPNSTTSHQKLGIWWLAANESYPANKYLLITTTKLEIVLF